MLQKKKACALDLSNTEANPVNIQVSLCLDEANKWFDNVGGYLLSEPLLLFYPAVGADTRLLVLSALSFGGGWADKFYPLNAKNKHARFYRLNGVPVPASVSLMTTNVRQCISCYDGFIVLRVPSKRGSHPRVFAVYIFLPDKR
ncbi:uncharacterized protein A4U43_C03F21860 [Asparagus officinalis]|uniref:Uncharacterized protein n=1 Tax=Asparagus officinalis TaxID=4686 RepID=A0A5P1FGY4_ASPOF|nr:uncharacterized protein A4U43_C03F21860 [Asparagus officinalis]